MDKEQILKLLETSDKAIGRALIVLYERQTADEQACDSTVEHNGRGFSAAHAEIGSSMARFYMGRHYLTQKQVAYWRAKTASGRMRIAIYWKQLAEAAAEKAAKRAERESIPNDEADPRWIARLDASLEQERQPAA